jgi:hypothetical protein
MRLIENRVVLGHLKKGRLPLIPPTIQTTGIGSEVGMIAV